MVRLVSPAVQIDERFVLIEHDPVETPVVVEIADSQTPIQIQPSEISPEPTASRLLNYLRCPS